MAHRFFVFLISAMVLAAVVTAQPVTLPEIDISGSPDGIVPLPENTPSLFTDVFVNYTKITAPNGKPIHFLAQDAWSHDKILKARNILEHILTDYPGSQYGHSKEAVANAMADRKATMVLFNSSQAARSGRFDRDAVDLFLQSLWENETTAEGSEDYLNHITRDAAYEEVLHLVQGAGIIPALPEFQQEVTIAHAAYRDAGKYTPPPSHNNPIEYYAQQLDVYLDLWVIQPKKWEGRDLKPGEMPEGTAHWGQNVANSRARLLEADPEGYRLVSEFFHPYLTYTPVLPADFEGTFSIEYNPRLIYTYKSQHLRNVSLSGSKDAGLIGNSSANVLTGNDGNNTLQGGKGDDQLFGGKGKDTAVFSGNSSDYLIEEKDGYTLVMDYRVNSDGMDYLVGFEILKFRDQELEL